MATPLTADKMLAAYRAFDVNVQEVRDWRNHNRNHKGAWGPVNGIIVHHTVSSGTAKTVGIVYDGYEGLPGPLCHGMIGKDGVVYTISAGRANHAGTGDPAVLAAVQNENYGDSPPATRFHEGESGGADGNAHFYGFECENLGNGTDPWTAAQMHAIVYACAALCKAHGWTAKSVIGHKEWSDWKSDPTFSMVELRRSIQLVLDGKAPNTPVPPANPPTPGTKPSVDLSELQRAAKADPPAEQGHQTYAAGVRPVESALVKVGLLSTSLATDGSFGSSTVKAYSDWQKRLGYTGADADGIPGMQSLTKLGQETGLFVVVQ